MEDIRLGRKKYARVSVVAVPPAGVGSQIIGADPKRINFVITTTDGTVLAISDKPLASLNDGLRVAPNNTNLADFSVEDHGSFVMGEVFAWSAAGCSVALLETSLAEV